MDWDKVLLTVWVCSFVFAAVSLCFAIHYLDESGRYLDEARQNIEDARQIIKETGESLKTGTYPWDDTWRAFEGDEPNPYALETSKEVSAEIFDLMQRYGEGEFSDIEYGTLLLDAGRRHAAARWREKEYGVNPDG